jgi:hypothetical protein
VGRHVYPRTVVSVSYTINIKLSVLVYYKVDLIIISLKINMFSLWYSWKIAHLALNNNNHSLTPCCCHAHLCKVFFSAQKSNGNLTELGHSVCSYICTKLSTGEWNVEPPTLVLPNWLKVDNSNIYSLSCNAC